MIAHIGVILGLVILGVVHLGVILELVILGLVILGLVILGGGWVKIGHLESNIDYPKIKNHTNEGHT